MRKLFIFIAALLWVITACTKSDLRVQGFVQIENTTNPVSEATVALQKSKKILETTTDATGFYMFENVPSGTWEITVIKEGFETQTKTFSMSHGADGNIYHKDFGLKKNKL